MAQDVLCIKLLKCLKDRSIKYLLNLDKRGEQFLRHTFCSLFYRHRIRKVSISNLLLTSDYRTIKCKINSFYYIGTRKSAVLYLIHIFHHRLN